MWYGEMCVHLYDLLDVLAAKATATTEATATTAAAKKTPHKRPIPKIYSENTS